MMRKETDKERIKEFYDLVENPFILRKYHKPVLVYDIEGDKIRYSLWEEELLNRFGLKNVDGWDATEDLIFCPDWMRDDMDDEGEDINDDDDLDLDLKGLDI